MSDTNRVRLAIAKTAASAIPIPDSAPPTGAQELKQLRITGTPNLASQPQTLTSSEIRPDRELTGLILTGVEAGGDAGIEQSFGATEDLLEGVLFNVWSAVEIALGVTGAGAVLTLGAAGNWADGMIARAEGFTTGDGVWIIASGGTTTALTMAALDGGTPPAFTGTGTLKLAGVRVVAATAALTVAAGIGTITLGVNTAVVAYGTQAVGDWMQLGPAEGQADFTNAVNKGLFRISSVTATEVLVEGPNMIAEDFTMDIDVYFGERLRAGSISIPNSSYIVERAYTDQENEDTPGRYTRELFVGMAINQWNEGLTPAQIATAVPSFFGLRSFARRQNASAELYANGDLQALSNDAEAGVTAGLSSVGDNQIYNTASSVARIGRGGVNLVDPLVTKNLVNELTMTVNNNLRRRLAVGRFGTASMGLGELNVTGTLNTFFDDITVLEEMLTDGFRTSIEYALRDGTGRSLLTDLPEVAFASGAPDVPGKNADVTAPIGYQALRDPTLGFTISKQRYEYLAA